MLKEADVWATEELNNYLKHLTRILFSFITGSLRTANKQFWGTVKPDKQQESWNLSEYVNLLLFQIPKYICIDFGVW